MWISGRKVWIQVAAADKPPSTNAAPTRASTTSARVLLEIFRRLVEWFSNLEISGGFHCLAVKGLVRINASRPAPNAALAKHVFDTSLALHSER